MFNLKQHVSKNEKWTDTLKRDNEFCGIGTANNQLNRPDGSKSEIHSSEDRSFAFVLKDESIYVYGLLDGFNGTYAVDFVNDNLLLNFFIDYLNEKFEEKNDREIFSIIKEQIRNIESFLERSLGERLNDRTSLSINMSEIGPNDPHYREFKNKIEKLDNEINSGVFLALVFIVGHRLFTVNVGTVHCFMCSVDGKNNISSIPLSIDHTLTNKDEEVRIQNINGITNPNDLTSSDEFINYTRCIGDYKIKLYYKEYEQFKDCTQPPIISNSEHYDLPQTITNDCLFFVMYSDALAKTIEKTGVTSVDEKIVSSLLEKIKNEATLNTATQAVVDEIKREYDTFCVPGNLEFRDDLTLIVRVLKKNFKEILISCYQLPCDSMTDTLDHDSSSAYSSIVNSNVEENYDSFDQNGNIIAYVDFSQFESLLNNHPDTKLKLENFENELENLENIDDNSRL